MNREHDAEPDPSLLAALQQLTDPVDVPPADPMAYAARVAGSDRPRRIAPLLAVLAGTAVAVLFAFSRLGSGLTGQVPTPSPQLEPSLSPAATDPAATLRPTSDPSASPSATPAPPACAPVAPRELPNGDPPGTMRDVVGELGPTWEWGAGDNMVILAANHPSFSGSEFPPPEMFDAVVRGNPAAVQTIGDSELSTITLTWMEGPCTYTIWVGPGLSVEEAREYGARY